MFNRMEIRGALTVCALLLAIVLLSVHISLDIPVLPAVQSVRFHLAALMLPLVIALFALGARSRALVFALLTVASVGQGVLLLSTQQARRPPVSSYAGLPTIPVLHFNMRNTNLENGRAIADMVINSGAAFAFLPEALPIQPYLPELRQTYSGQIGCTNDVPCDLLFLSRYPLSDIRVHTISRLSPNRVFSAHADVNGTSVAIVAVHLTKPYYDSWSVEEITNLIYIVNAMKGPVIISGDFNGAVWSPDLQNLQRSGKLLPAPSFPSTWPSEVGAYGVPIDNMFTRGAVITAIDALPSALGSNHRGLKAEIALLPPVLN